MGTTASTTWGNPYSWDAAFSAHVALLNSAGFAGHTDWRLPNVKELVSIVNYENVGPAVSPAFNTNCISPCTVLTCSCTQASFYWSSSSYAIYPQFDWNVDFVDGSVSPNPPASNFFVRAVRGGA